ncbi:MAG: hypothetical protein QW331_02350 [Candidatus Woesearchaeota archaeon]
MKEKIQENDLVEEIKIKVDKDAMKGPLTCTGCGTKMKKIKSDLTTEEGDITIHYEVWKCDKCGKELLSEDQAKKVDSLLDFQKVLSRKTIDFERALNFDGQSFFIRFPNSITKSWTRGAKADLKALSGTDFLIHVHKGKK